MKQSLTLIARRIMLTNLRAGFMTGRDISTDILDLQADLLDHSREFVEIVYRSAPD